MTKLIPIALSVCLTFGVVGTASAQAVPQAVLDQISLGANLTELSESTGIPVETLEDAANEAGFQTAVATEPFNTGLGGLGVGGVAGVVLVVGLLAAAGGGGGSTSGTNSTN